MRNRKEIEDDASLNVYGKLLEVALDLRDMFSEIRMREQEEFNRINEEIETSLAATPAPPNHLG